MSILQESNQEREIEEEILLFQLESGYTIEIHYTPWHHGRTLHVVYAKNDHEYVMMSEYESLYASSMSTLHAIQNLRLKFSQWMKSN